MFDLDKVKAAANSYKKREAEDQKKYQQIKKQVTDVFQSILDNEAFEENLQASLESGFRSKGCLDVVLTLDFDRHNEVSLSLVDKTVHRTLFNKDVQIQFENKEDNEDETTVLVILYNGVEEIQKRPEKNVLSLFSIVSNQLGIKLQTLGLQMFEVSEPENMYGKIYQTFRIKL